MRKVFTLFCVLMAAFFSIGVAKAQTTFQVSSSASENAHWYVITLDNFIISSDALEYGNKSFGGAAAFSMSSKNIKDAMKDASLWCIVGDDTKGYKLYNKAKVNGEYQILALNNSSTTNAGAYGASRAKLVSSSTESSTADNADGCAFDIREKGASYPNIYCIRLHNTTNRYLNNRDNNLSYWQDDAAFNSASAGSQVRFYEQDAYFDAKFVDSYTSLLLPGIGDNEAVSAAESIAKTNRTYSALQEMQSAISKVLATKYYRINNQRSNGIKQLATDGSNTPQMVSSANANRLVNAIWQFTLCDDGVKMTNVNNPDKFVAVLSDADVNSTLTNPLTTQENGIKLVFSKFNNGKFCIKDGDGHLMNGENDTQHGNYALNHWSSTLAWNNGNGTDGNQWDIVEAPSIEVALHELDNKSYASVYLPFGVSTVENATAYVAETPANGYVTFNTAGDGVAKQNGFLLVSDNASSTATITIGEGAATSQMTGTLTNLTINESNISNYRVFGPLSTDATVLGFFKPSATLSQISANRGFFKNVANEALRLNFGNVVSAIETIEANGQNNAPIFDLSGRRVMKTVKGGLYIQNGRKFIVK